MKAGQKNSISDTEANTSPWPVRVVCICGLALVAIFSAIYWLSPPFEYRSDAPRPILGVTGLLVIASVISFVGLTSALKSTQRQRKTLVWLILSFAISARFIAVFTCPILEVDYYRYLWDGKVVTEGISPYLYSPEQVLNAGANEVGTLRELNSLSLRFESNHTIISRIHFEDHTTIYPPVSQFVFASVMQLIPNSASVETHIVAIKVALVLFDIATMVLVLFLLRKLRIKLGWLIVYAWNPLVIKEIANSGHLDSIATFLMVSSIFLLIRWQLSRSEKTRIWFLAGSGMVLGLGFGAKLFPIVLVPALAIHVSRKSWEQASLFSLLFVATAMASLWPMLNPILDDDQPTQMQSASDEGDQLLVSSPLPADDPREGSNEDAKNGAVGFFSSWEMNDTVFALVYLNFKNSDRASNNAPWYVLTSPKFREDFERWCGEKSIGGSNPAFFSSKIITLGMFLIFYGWQLVVIRRSVWETGIDSAFDCVVLLQRLAVVLTVFLFLQPTVNPWYFVWLMPFACFAKNQGWLLVSGLLLTYYSRFWFKSLDGPYQLFGREYSGVGLYDHWVILFTTLLMLAALWFFRTSKSSNKRKLEWSDDSIFTR